MSKNAMEKTLEREGAQDMIQTHTSYEFSKRLKEFLGESAPEPISPWAYDAKIKTKGPWKWHEEERRKTDFPAYQLHDLLSKPFCEAMNKRMKSPSWFNISTTIFHAYVLHGGLPSVEKALTKMMEAK